jgi:tRNA nucleotidyltransferase (CCA-adding enzyme)
VGQNDYRLTGWLLWLLGLTEKQIQSLNKRLHFTTPYLEALQAASRLFVNLGKLMEWKPSKCVEYLDEMPYPAIQAVYLAAPDGNIKLPLEKYIKEWRHVRPRTTGTDLKRLGLRPGPDYHTILRELRNAWLDREIQDEQGEKRRLEETLRRLQNLQG